MIKYIIFPYNADGSLISIDVMKKEYPGTYQYLEDCYELLVPKCLNGGKGRDIKNATADTWYQYGRTQALTAFINVLERYTLADIISNEAELAELLFYRNGLNSFVK